MPREDRTTTTEASTCTTASSSSSSTKTSGASTGSVHDEDEVKWDGAEAEGSSGAILGTQDGLGQKECEV